MKILQRKAKWRWSWTMAGVSLFFLLFPPLPVTAQNNTSFTFNEFDSSTLELFGISSVHSRAIALTDQSRFSIGRAFYPHPVRMKDGVSLNSTLSFRTSFVFQVIKSNMYSGHGLAFIMTPHKSPEGFLASQYLGLIRNISSIGKPSNHLFAVEFDTARSVEFMDINDNHVGVDLNDLISVQSKPAGFWTDNNQLQDLDLDDGGYIQAWIDYDHILNELKVTIAEACSSRPEKPLIYLKNLSLANILEEEMYVGFSASTGVLIDETYIVAWSFTTKRDESFTFWTLCDLITPRETPKSSNSRFITGITTAAAGVVLLLLILVVAAIIMRRKRKRYGDIIEEWEMEYWPHRFKYKDLHVATKGFEDEELLGSGGFGRVYRGILPTSSLQAAVKCILRETEEGMREFIAEISSLGRLQHRNLVQIRGFCRRVKQLFIVYDYMPNGSLDKKIFGKPKEVFKWVYRYKILTDVAAGLLYLHEEWGQCVVHRDIKSSNVLLDSELNGKLGDFGLARLYEHNENSHTTRVVGTLGYIAPELIHTGKASPATDVFSFGIFLLEVACGRRPVEPSLEAEQVVMVDWVRELYAAGTMMDAVDPNLGGQYVEVEMDRVLKLGLLCSNPQPEGRIGIRLALQILEEEAPIPGFDAEFHLEMNAPNATLKSPPNSISTSLGGR